MFLTQTPSGYKKLWSIIAMCDELKIDNPWIRQPSHAQKKSLDNSEATTHPPPGDLSILFLLYKEEGVWKFRPTVFIFVFWPLLQLTSYREILPTTLMVEISHFLTLIAANFGLGTITKWPRQITPKYIYVSFLFLVFYFWKLLNSSQWQITLDKLLG